MSITHYGECVYTLNQQTYRMLSFNQNICIKDEFDLIVK